VATCFGFLLALELLIWCRYYMRRGIRRRLDDFYSLVRSLLHSLIYSVRGSLGGSLEPSLTGSLTLSLIGLLTLLLACQLTSTNITVRRCIPRRLRPAKEGFSGSLARSLLPETEVHGRATGLDNRDNQDSAAVQASSYPSTRCELDLSTLASYMYF
jgi:hypothetical protein